MARPNCWEVKKCGRELGGAKTLEMGICPAATTMVANGINGGKNAGRYCWLISGTFCQGEVQGTFAQKRLSCLTCDFFRSVRDEEGLKFVMDAPLRRILA